MKEMINDVNNIISNNFKDKKIIDIFNNVYMETIEKGISVLPDDSIFMVTGDIPAMWLRDSVCQVRPYLPFINKYPEVKEIIYKLIKKQFEFILEDPYANAFNQEPNGNKWDDDIPLQKPIVWERKYELDSHCFPILLAFQYWKITDDSSVFNEDFYQAITKILEIWEIEQNHNELSDYEFFREETGYLKNNGKGSATKKTGLIWSAFRPSDDPCEYHYNIPANFFAVYCLELLDEIILENQMNNDNIRLQIDKIKKKIINGIANYGIIKTSDNKLIYAYEVDGLGNYLLIDDSNMPNLLSLPLLSGGNLDNEIYMNTRDYILSFNNPYYYEGKLAAGIGSAHTPSDYIWPMSLAIEGLTTDNLEEKLEKLSLIANTDADTFQIHESFNKDDEYKFTRKWFLWANAMFCELVLDYSGINIEKAMLK